MSRIVNIVTDQIYEMNAIPSELVITQDEKKKDSNIVLKNKLLQLVAVLQQGGQFRGFNRKIQIRPLKWEKCSAEDTSDYSGSESGSLLSPSNSLMVVPSLRSPTNPASPASRSNSEDIRHSYDFQHDSSCEDEHGLGTKTTVIPAMVSSFELRRGVEKVRKRSEWMNG